MADADPMITTDAIGAPQRRRVRPLRIAAYAIGIFLALVFLAWAILYITKGRFLKGSTAYP